MLIALPRLAPSCHDSPESTARAARGCRPQVVVIGGDSAGLEAAKALAGAPADIVRIDRQNYDCF